MFKKLQDFIDDIKRQDGDVPSIEGANDQGFFCKDDGCPSQPINKEEKPNLFDELGGIPAPESDDWAMKMRTKEKYHLRKYVRTSLKISFNYKGFFLTMMMKYNSNNPIYSLLKV